MALVVETNGKAIFGLRYWRAKCDLGKFARWSQRVKLCRQCMELGELRNGMHWVARNSSLARVFGVEVVLALNKYCSVIDVAQNECHGE